MAQSKLATRCGSATYLKSVLTFAGKTNPPATNLRNLTVYRLERGESMVTSVNHGEETF